MWNENVSKKKKLSLEKFFDLFDNKFQRYKKNQLNNKIEFNLEFVSIKDLVYNEK